MNRASLREWTNINPTGIFPFKPSGGLPDVPVKTAQDKPNEHEVELCVQWLKLHAQMTNRIASRGPTSYQYKHDVEYWLRDLGRSEYISNGAFIVAAQRLGYVVERESPGSCNAVFNMKTGAALIKDRGNLNLRRMKLYAIMRATDRYPHDAEAFVGELIDKAYKELVTPEFDKHTGT